MKQIELEYFSKLSLEDKTHRMDEYLEELRRERNPFYDRGFDLSPYIEPFTKTKIFIGHKDQTKLLWSYFDLVLQIEYVLTYFGYQNSVLDSEHFKRWGWESPANHTNYSALIQAVIIGSRIEFERFMYLIYFAFESKDISGDSTFGEFKKWISGKDADHDHTYILPFLKVARGHDREFRTAEIHTGSKLKAHALALKEHSGDKQNDVLKLHNCVNNLLRNVFPLFDFQRPSSASGSADFDLKWLEAYSKKDKVELEHLKEDWLKEMP